MKIGITSYAFRYLLEDPKRAPSLRNIVEMTPLYGLDRLQVCENGRPTEFSKEDWRDLVRHAADKEAIDLGWEKQGLARRPEAT